MRSTRTRKEILPSILIGKSLSGTYLPHDTLRSLALAPKQSPLEIQVKVQKSRWIDKHCATNEGFIRYASSFRVQRCRR